jgi:hypothetical protein
MTRWMVAFPGVLALTVVAFANDADARGFTRKRCIPPDKAQTWVCKASEKCCYDYTLRQGTCPSDRCF